MTKFRYLNDYLNVTFDWNTYGDGQLPTLSHSPDPGAQLPLPLPETSQTRQRQVRQSDRTHPWSGTGVLGRTLMPQTLTPGFVAP